jgi:hypothetical protein
MPGTQVIGVCTVATAAGNCVANVDVGGTI